MEILHNLTRFPEQSYGFRVVGRFLFHSSPRRYVSIVVDKTEVLHILIKTAESRGNCIELCIEAYTTHLSSLIESATNATAFSLIDVVPVRSMILGSGSAEMGCFSDNVKCGSLDADAAPVDVVCSIVTAESPTSNNDNCISINVEETNVEVLECYEIIEEFEEVPHPDFVDSSHFHYALNGQCYAQ